jgi:hypothetical protein
MPSTCRRACSCARIPSRSPGRSSGRRNAAAGASPTHSVRPCPCAPSTSIVRGRSSRATGARSWSRRKTRCGPLFTGHDPTTYDASAPACLITRRHHPSTRTQLARSRCPLRVIGTKRSGSTTVFTIVSRGGSKVRCESMPATKAWWAKGSAAVSRGRHVGSAFAHFHGSGP